MKKKKTDSSVTFQEAIRGLFLLKRSQNKDPIFFFFHGFQWDITRDGASLVAQTVKNPPAIWESWIQSLGWQDPMEESMTTHSRILAWRIPIDRGAWWASYSPWDRKESDTTKQLSTAQHKGHVRGNVLSYRVCDLNGHLESSQLQWYPTRPQEPTGIVSKALTLRNANPVALNKACSPLLNCKQKPPNMLCT